MNKFYEYSGDLMGLPTDDNHINFRWNNPDCKILFSICRQGNGVCGHFASDKKGLRKLKVAMKEMIKFVFNKYDWCEMIFAKVKTELKSVKRLDEAVGFKFLLKDGDIDYYYYPRGEAL